MTLLTTLLQFLLNGTVDVFFSFVETPRTMTMLFSQCIQWFYVTKWHKSDVNLLVLWERYLHMQVVQLVEECSSGLSCQSTLDYIQMYLIFCLFNIIDDIMHQLVIIIICNIESVTYFIKIDSNSEKPSSGFMSSLWSIHLWNHSLVHSPFQN
jgi:hypothetical protein